MALNLESLSVAALEAIAALIPDMIKAKAAGGGVVAEGEALADIVLADPAVKSSMSAFIAAL